ncbi:unnamed protein product [Vitrella brassicaformis CCMP3155]|uniref:RNI-like protein n=3 Tax=Vitrella brassicaformis TaxID=1169539 RepID=A0A0G4F8B9_VITBC|nr:unnamed protein product [Vitrella brassicaformis CCMP3155]|eukprot:CEM08962.1 unnamed protein product [Vitrella brassicaformis CCMP3155]
MIVPPLTIENQVLRATQPRVTEDDLGLFLAAVEREVHIEAVWLEGLLLSDDALKILVPVFLRTVAFALPSSGLVVQTPSLQGPGLREINLSTNRMSDSAALILAECIARLPALTRLDVSNNWIGPEGGIPLAKAFFPDYTSSPTRRRCDARLDGDGQQTETFWLDLSDNYVGPETCFAVAETIKCNRCHAQVGLRNVRCDPAGSMAIAACLDFLHSIDLSSNLLILPDLCAIEAVCHLLKLGSTPSPTADMPRNNLKQLHLSFLFDIYGSKAPSRIKTRSPISPPFPPLLRPRAGVSPVNDTPITIVSRSPAKPSLERSSDSPPAPLSSPLAKSAPSPQLNAVSPASDSRGDGRPRKAAGRVGRRTRRRSDGEGIGGGKGVYRVMRRARTGSVRSGSPASVGSNGRSSDDFYLFCPLTLDDRQALADRSLGMIAEALSSGAARDLWAFSFAGNEVTDVGCEAWVRGIQLAIEGGVPPPPIEELDLSFNHLTQTDILTEHVVCKLPLRVLDLAGNNITDAAGATLIQGIRHQHPPTLRHLNLSHNPVSDKTAEALAELLVSHDDTGGTPHPSPSAADISPSSDASRRSMRRRFEDESPTPTTSSQPSLRAQPQQQQQQPQQRRSPFSLRKGRSWVCVDPEERASDGEALRGGRMGAVNLSYTLIGDSGAFSLAHAIAASPDGPLALLDLSGTAIDQSGSRAVREALEKRQATPQHRQTDAQPAAPLVPLVKGLPPVAIFLPECEGDGNLMAETDEVPLGSDGPPIDDGYYDSEGVQYSDPDSPLSPAARGDPTWWYEEDLPDDDGYYTWMSGGVVTGLDSRPAAAAAAAAAAANEGKMVHRIPDTSSEGSPGGSASRQPVEYAIHTQRDLKLAPREGAKDAEGGGGGKGDKGVMVVALSNNSMRSSDESDSGDNGQVEGPFLKLPPPPDVYS